MFSIFHNTPAPFKTIEIIELPKPTLAEYMANARKTLDLIAVDIEIADLLRLKGDVDSINESKAVLERSVASYKEYVKMHEVFPPELLSGIIGLEVLNEIYKLNSYADSIKEGIEEVSQSIHFINSLSCKR